MLNVNTFTISSVLQPLINKYVQLLSIKQVDGDLPTDNRPAPLYSTIRRLSKEIGKRQESFQLKMVIGKTTPDY